MAAGQRITNVIDNGSGLCRVTITGHRYHTGFEVTVTNVQGVPGANGTFLITVIDANTFDMIASKFSGAYISGGISINWPTAKLLAQGDGSLIITDATISLTGTGGSIVIDPTTPSIIITGAGGTIVIDASVPDIVATDLSGNFASFAPGQVAVVSPTFGESIMGTLGFEIVNSASLGNVQVVSIGLDSSVTGNGFLSVRSDTGTASVVVNAGITSILTVTGGDVNVATPNVYRRGGVAGLTVSRNMVASLTTVANGVIGTPGVGQANTTVVTGVSLTASGFSGGILTS